MIFYFRTDKPLRMKKGRPEPIKIVTESSGYCFSIDCPDIAALNPNEVLAVTSSESDVKDYLLGYKIAETETYYIHRRFLDYLIPTDLPSALFKFKQVDMTGTKIV